MSIMDNKKVDLVFIIDSSLSMKDEAEALCAKLESAIEEARKACPSDLRTDFLVSKAFLPAPNLIKRSVSS